MGFPSSLPVALARIRIAIPADWLVPILLLLLIAAVLASLALQSRDWKRWGLPALSALVAADLIVDLLRSVTGAGGLLWALLVSGIVGNVLLVWAVLVVWGVRKRLDAASIALAAVVFAVTSSLATSWLVGGSAVWAILLPSIAGMTLWAACFLGALALLGTHVRPAWAGVFAGAVVGTLIGGLASALVLPMISRGQAGPSLAAWIPWALARGVVTGALLAIAVRLLKPEQAWGRRVIAPGR